MEPGIWKSEQNKLDYYKKMFQSFENWTKWTSFQMTTRKWQPSKWQIICLPKIDLFVN
jgi:hypothetical protein